MISLIVAADSNRAIGFENKLLCRLKDDMKHFVKTTKNKPVIMGSTTFASLGNKPLKDRFNVVLTKSPMALTLQHANIIEENENLLFESLEYIKFMVEQSPDVEFMVIGGQQTYELFLPLADRIYYTSIQKKFPKADAYFPKLDVKDWTIVDSKMHLQNEDNDYPFNIYILERVG
ncbi:dihydrofolate reductase [Gottfriedia acidiceleris]|uniref:dihydrofolate reductase n=1 Tax=Gottfriedia acidiceleris TaxID=371036 RepID=UPI00339365F2